MEKLSSRKRLALYLEIDATVFLFIDVVRFSFRGIIVLVAEHMRGKNKFVELVFVRNRNKSLKCIKIKLVIGVNEV